MKIQVTKAIRQPRIQPYGGYLPLHLWGVQCLVPDDDYSKKVEEILKYSGLHQTKRGLIVDYLCRLEIRLLRGLDLRESAKEAFIVSLAGAKRVGREEEAQESLEAIMEEYAKDDLERDYNVIVQSASDLVHYDGAVRGDLLAALRPKNITTRYDARSIALMVSGSISYLLANDNSHLEDGVEFFAEDSENILPSDGDYISRDSLIDMKVSKKSPSPQNTLQVLVYYVMGLHEQPDRFAKLKYLKILNPRLGKVFVYRLEQLNPSTIREVASDIIGYNRKIIAEIIKQNNNK